ncbi:response regulator [Halodesulfovibrio marinisediminis]|uniref:response regulator n=1 Tax=Halodesulfovibrio marinisediminis TaxID=458711 RepID=UPI001587FC16|nr:response regulator [Halodesulfovibrio marinisediminis]
MLIVEDDAVSATLHKTMLESEGHSIVGVARSEDEAIELARNKNPDLVLMDIYLEDGTSGVHAAKEMYSSYALPVIFITCGTAVEQLQELVDSDAFALIKKPVSLEELRVNLSIVMRRAAEIKQSKEQAACYEALLSQLPVAMFSVCRNNTIDWCNQAFAAVLGYASQHAFFERCSDTELLVGAEKDSLWLVDTGVRVRQDLRTASDEMVSKVLRKIECQSVGGGSECCFFILE